jgi:hypothetical protein
MTMLAIATTAALASSHREAPAISLDPSADISDFYAFISPDDPDKVVFLMNVNPLEAPGGGPNFHRFDDSVRYKIHVDNEGDGIADKVFVFQFDTTYAMPDTFLYNVGPVDNLANVNIQQTYTAWVMEDGVRRDLVTDANPGKVAPINVGVASDGGYDPYGTGLSTLTASYIKTAGDYRFFAGPRQEGFYVDLERTFDLLNLGYTDNTNTLLGYNVHTIAIEVPMTELTRDGQFPSALNQNEVIACWATTHRQRVRVLNDDGSSDDSGNWQQVSRLGNPLVNEVVIPIKDKDLFNASRPMDDIQFLSYVTDPLLPVYMEAILGIPNPGSYDAGLGIGGREDLVLAFLTGHPALGTMPGGYALGGPIPGEFGKTFGAFEALRMNLTLPTGFPNGRLVQDDVVDVALSAMAGLLIDGTFVPDGVDSTGVQYLDTFPFLGDPWSGDDHPAGYHQL